jgi:hypothetical protein
MVFSEFAERLDMLEQQCHSQDKKALHNLQGWPILRCTQNLKID